MKSRGKIGVCVGIILFSFGRRKNVVIEFYLKKNSAKLGRSGNAIGMATFFVASTVVVFFGEIVIFTTIHIAAVHIFRVGVSYFVTRFFFRIIAASKSGIRYQEEFQNNQYYEENSFHFVNEIKETHFKIN